MDDGSTDHTAELVKAWQAEENGFEIRYVYKENGGMHTAHNTAYENVDTELNVCIDSDDAMAENAVALILEKWEQVRNNGYAGIMGLDADFAGRVIGSGFPEGLTESTVSGYYAAGGSGDKKLVYRTDIIKSVPPYPVFEGEKYVALSYKYRLIDQKYKMAVLDRTLCNVEYQEDGSTKNMWRQYLRNPKGFAFWRLVRLQTPESAKRTLIDYVHYCSSSILAREKSFIRKAPSPALCAVCTPAGFLLSCIVKKKAR